jgi:tetrahydrodipicolinate N-succinyltransferase
MVRGLGKDAIILPDVTIGGGAVVTAGSVVSSSVEPMTVVQGNPARPIARCGVRLGEKTTMEQFLRSLRRLKKASVHGARSVDMIGRRAGLVDDATCSIPVSWRLWHVWQLMDSVD